MFSWLKAKPKRRAVEPLSEKAKGILETRIKRFDGVFLFPQNDTDGRDAIKTPGVQHIRTVKRIGFKFRLYNCRYTFATRALESGVDLLTLASILGHANLKMVSRYAHPSEERKAEAIRLMKNQRGKSILKAAKM
jgi:integrase